MGSYNTLISPKSFYQWNPQDRLFVIGNGSSYSNRSDALVVLKNGHVGIGDSTPTEGTLVVSGTVVVSKDIFTKSTLTPDYVFEKYFLGFSSEAPNYKFLSLTEVRDFISKFYHLPNLPSSTKIKKEGRWTVNRAVELNLEKIEELFLHTIEQENKIQLLQIEIQNLLNKIEDLESKVIPLR